MCESLVGAENATTRQKGTDTFNPAGVPNRPPVLGTSKSGGALIDVADVIVTFGIFSDVRLSQDCCADARAGTKNNPASTLTNRDRPQPCFMRIPPWSRITDQTLYSGPHRRTEAADLHRPSIPVSVADDTPILLACAPSHADSSRSSLL